MWSGLEQPLEAGRATGSLHAAEAGLYSGVWVGGGSLQRDSSRGSASVLQVDAGAPLSSLSPPAAQEPLRPFVSSHLWEPVLQNGACTGPGEAYRKVSETKGSACPRTALDINRQAGRARAAPGHHLPPTSKGESSSPS